MRPVDVNRRFGEHTSWQPRCIVSCRVGLNLLPSGSRIYGKSSTRSSQSDKSYCTHGPNLHTYVDLACLAVRIQQCITHSLRELWCGETRQEHRVPFRENVRPARTHRRRHTLPVIQQRKHYPPPQFDHHDRQHEHRNTHCAYTRKRRAEVTPSGTQAVRGQRREPTKHTPTFYQRELSSVLMENPGGSSNCLFSAAHLFHSPASPLSPLFFPNPCKARAHGL